LPLYELHDDGLRRHDVAGFAALGIYERADLQRLLRDDIAVLGSDLLVIAEEFGNWEDSRRRIDLLALDKTGHLVVIELKRTDDGGHMELQALRYAAMVSTMRFEDVVSTYESHLNDEAPVVSSDVRIVLVAANFSREVTTTVLWLNRFDGMDVRCVRLVPYEIDSRVLLDIQQVIPLPEAGDYQVRFGRKLAEQERSDSRDLTRYHIVVDGHASEDLNKRHAVRRMVQSLVDRGIPAAEIGGRLTPGRFRRLDGELHTEEDVRTALAEQYPGVTVDAWFTEYAIVEDGRTWILRRVWGRATEPTLIALSEAFPAAKVTFRQASSA
jgi:hypothetical protein